MHARLTTDTLDRDMSTNFVSYLALSIKRDMIVIEKFSKS